jgi:tetratricopeptide (TPR) repeat protein
MIAEWPGCMASLYRDQRQYDKAEPLYDRARVILETALGPEHPRRGSFYERALAIWEKALGPVHPKVAAALGNYASLLRSLGRSDEATPLEARAREIRAKSA